MDNLYFLIKTLTAEEKKYFRRFGTRAGDIEKTAAQKLFDAIDKMEIADDDILKARLRKESFVKQMAVLKHQLYQQLLQVLAYYHLDTDEYMQLLNSLIQVRLLQTKSLDEEAAKLLAKVEEAAQAKEYFNLQLEAMQMLGKYFSNQEAAERSETKWLNLMQKRELVLEKTAEIEQLELLHGRQMLLMKSAMHSRSDEVVKQHKEIFESASVQTGETKSLRAALTRCFIRLHFFMSTGNTEQHYKECEAVVQWLQQHPVLEQMNFPAVLWLYMQYVHSTFFINDVKAFEHALSLLADLKGHTEFDHIARFVYYLPFALHLCDLRQQHERMYELLDEAEQKFGEWGKKIRPDIRLGVTISCISARVEHGQYAKALDLIDDYLQNYDTGVRVDALLMLYFYQLICHFELGNKLYVENILPNVYRYLLRKNYKGPLEDVILKFFKKLTALADAEKQVSTFHELQNDMHRIIEQQHIAHQHKSLVPVIDSYIQAKLSAKPYHVYLKERKPVL